MSAIFKEVCSKDCDPHVHSFYGNKTERFPTGNLLPDQRRLTWADCSSILVMGIALGTMVFKRRITALSDNWLLPFAVNITKPNGSNSWSKFRSFGSINSSSTPQLSAHHMCLLHAPVQIIHCAPFSLVLHFHSPLTAVVSIDQPQLQSCKTDTDTGHRRGFMRQCSGVLLSIKKNHLSEGKAPWIALVDFCGINIPSVANSKLPMCHHWTWSRKGGTRYLSQACRTSSRDPTKDRPSETLDYAFPVDVPKATRAQLLCLSYNAWLRIQGGILSLLPCPLGSTSSSLGTEGWVTASKMFKLFLSPFVHILV